MGFWRLWRALPARIRVANINQHMQEVFACMWCVGLKRVGEQLGVGMGFEEQGLDLGGVQPLQSCKLGQGWHTMPTAHPPTPSAASPRTSNAHLPPTPNHTHIPQIPPPARIHTHLAAPAG